MSLSNNERKVQDIKASPPVPPRPPSTAKGEYRQRIWLCGLASDKVKVEGLKQLIGPILEFFDGLVWTYHGDTDAESYKYLEENKKDGQIISAEWTGRYDFARNNYLFRGPIQEFDWFVNIDDCERLSREFCEKQMIPLAKAFEKEGVDGVYLHNKFFMFQLNEWMFFKNSIHESMHGCAKSIELTNVKGFEDSSVYFQNVREVSREKFEFVDKYVRYYMTRGSIHCLLGCEDKLELYKKRMEHRSVFRQYILFEGFSLDVNGVMGYLQKHDGNFNPQVLEILNFEKILNDFYRYHFLDRADFEDDHDRGNMVKIANTDLGKA